MPFLDRLYTSAMYLAGALAPLAGRGEGKLARGIRGRRGAVARMEAWAGAHRRRDRPLVWFHAPSVGEGLQARAVMEAFREIRPDDQLVYTHFSPSAESLAAAVPADIADYLPLDIPRDLERVLDALDPSVIAFSKTEVWPNLTKLATERRIPVVLLSATLPESSSRLGYLARGLLTPTHARLTMVAAISRADADRFEGLGVPEERRTVMGDARFDQVWRRANAARDSSLVQALSDPDRRTVVAGSTWPPDEERLIPAIAKLGDAMRVRFIIAPHEPTAAHLSTLEERLREHGLGFVRLGEASPGAVSPPVIVVDRVGVLGDLYALADVAYVGGGYGAAGLHSVLEPAAFGAPVVFGPRYSNSREAGELIAAGGAISALDTEALENALAAWLGGDVLCMEAGDRARSYVEQGLGAAEHGARIIEELLQPYQSAFSA